MTPAELLKLGFMVSILLAVLGLGLTTSWNRSEERRVGKEC